MPEDKEQKARDDYQKLVDRANLALAKEGVDVGAQVVLVLGDGQQIPVKAIAAQPVVVEQSKDEPKPPVEDSGKGSNNKPVPEQAK